MSNVTLSGAAPHLAQAKASLADLEKYAGWLAKGREALHARAAVKTLTNVLESPGDIGAAIQELDLAVRKLPPGHVTTLMRKALRTMYPGLESPAVRSENR